jgi:hypothetical protein
VPFYTSHLCKDLETNSPWIASMYLVKSAGSETVITFNILQEEDNVVEGSDNIVQDLVFESFSDVKAQILNVR